MHLTYFYSKSPDSDVSLIKSHITAFFSARTGRREVRQIESVRSRKGCQIALWCEVSELKTWQHTRKPSGGKVYISSGNMPFNRHVTIRRYVDELQLDRERQLRGINIE